MALLEAHTQRDACTGAALDHGFAISRRQRHWLFDQHMFAGGSRLQHFFAMVVVRGGDEHGIDRLISQHRGEPRIGSSPMCLGEGLALFGRILPTTPCRCSSGRAASAGAIFCAACIPVPISPQRIAQPSEANDRSAAAFNGNSGRGDIVRKVAERNSAASASSRGVQTRPSGDRRVIVAVRRASCSSPRIASRSKDGCARPLWTDAVGADAICAVISRNLARELQHASLGDTIGRHTGQRQQRALRGCVDDRAAACVTHLGENSAADEEHRLEVY